MLGLPISAHAEWTLLEGTRKEWVTNVTESAFGTSSLPSWNTVVNNYPYYPSASGNIKFANYISLSGTAIEKGEHFRIDVLRNGEAKFYYGTAHTSGNYTETVRSTRNFVYLCSQNGSSFSELSMDDRGFFYSDTVKPSYVVVAYTVVNAPSMSSSYAYRAMTLPYLNVYKDEPEPTFEGVVQEQTEQLTSTTGSDTVASDVTSQYSQQVEGLQIFQFVENLDETFKQTLTTQETDSSVVFPGMNLAGFVIPSANVDPLQLVPPDLVTPIKMIVTFTFCSAFVSHIISLLHAIFEIYDYSNTVWYDDERTVGDASVWHLNISG